MRRKNFWRTLKARIEPASSPARIFALATRNLLDIVFVCRRTGNSAFIMSSEIRFVRKFSLAEWKYRRV